MEILSDKVWYKFMSSKCRRINLHMIMWSDTLDNDFDNVFEAQTLFAFVMWLIFGTLL